MSLSVSMPNASAMTMNSSARMVGPMKCSEPVTGSLSSIRDLLPFQIMPSVRVRFYAILTSPPDLIVFFIPIPPRVVGGQ